MSITGKLALTQNLEAINECKELNLPTVTLIVAGRHVILENYLNDWNSIVMCYLPGSEGDGIANVLTGKSEIRGKLPMPWYQKVEDIKTDKIMFEVGYGLSYSK